MYAVVLMCPLSVYCPVNEKACLIHFNSVVVDGYFSHLFADYYNISYSVKALLL